MFAVPEAANIQDIQALQQEEARLQFESPAKPGKGRSTGCFDITCRSVVIICRSEETNSACGGARDFFSCSCQVLGLLILYIRSVYTDGEYTCCMFTINTHVVYTCLNQFK